MTRLTFVPTHLGKQSPIESDPDKVILDKIPNPNLSSIYVVRFTAPEFSSLCPVSGQPDFATIVIDYVPNQYLLESKSLKLYLFAFRMHGSFHEKCTVDIGKRIVGEIVPHWLRIVGFWNGRGGISIDVVWEYGTLHSSAKPLEINKSQLYTNR